jgi:aryl-alcohol dehydrogenase-like predicted oxidoreductase
MALHGNRTVGLCQPPDGETFAAMMQARDEGLIAGIGLSNITHEHLMFALERTEIVCVQNAFNLPTGPQSRCSRNA